jgi:ATP-binding cassette subfamily B protein
MEDNAQLNSYLVESLNGIQTIKAYSGEEEVRTETEFKFIKLLRSIFKLGSTGNIQEALKAFVEGVGGVVIIWAGAYNVLHGNITIGGLVTFNALLVYFLGPIKNIIDLQQVMQTAIVASDRLGDILDLELEKSGNQEAKIIPKSLSGDINFEDISFRYGTRPLVLEHFNMKIKQGQRAAIVGESGSGKTTLAKLLLNFYHCEAGSIVISDYSLQDIQIDILREKIAYVPQETFLFSGSIYDNLTFGVENPDMEEVIRCAKLAQVHEMINSLPLRYETHLDENGSNLSGGQRQRLAIARAMLKKPDILIFDEATSNLDAVTELAIQQTIDAYSRNLTSIIIAHRLSTIRSCDVIFVMDKGKVIESGSHEELMQLKGYYHRLYQAQIGA